MSEGCLLGIFFITYVAWVSFVELAPSMGLELEHPLFTGVWWHSTTLTLHSWLKLPTFNTNRRCFVMNMGRFNKLQTYTCKYYNAQYDSINCKHIPANITMHNNALQRLKSWILSTTYTKVSNKISKHQFK